MIRNLESFNDIRLLSQILDDSQRKNFLEVGCATGELYRYLQLRHPQLDYRGLDISRAAVARAQEKYPAARFHVSDPGLSLEENLRSLGLPERPEVVYAKDVVHHQERPFDFLSQLVEISSESLILRTRTRDEGATVTDPESSCQFQYGGWVPYIVFNVPELVDLLRERCPEAEIVLLRNHMVLGGKENRFLPKECYLPKTGTAETAVGLFKRTSHPGKLRLENRKDMPHPTGWKIWLKNLLRGGSG